MGDQSSISASKQKAHKQAQTESTNLDTKKVKKTMVRKAVQPGSDGGKKK